MSAIKDFMNNPKVPTPIVSSALFDKCVIRTCRGRSIRCRLGLWSVSAPDRATAEREARHYWQQYFTDGEYGKHLSNEKLSHGLVRRRGTPSDAGVELLKLSLPKEAAKAFNKLDAKDWTEQDWGDLLTAHNWVLMRVAWRHGLLKWAKPPNEKGQRT